MAAAAAATAAAAAFQHPGSSPLTPLRPLPPAALPSPLLSRPLFHGGRGRGRSREYSYLAHRYLSLAPTHARLKAPQRPPPRALDRKRARAHTRYHRRVSRPLLPSISFSRFLLVSGTYEASVYASGATLADVCMGRREGGEREGDRSFSLPASPRFLSFAPRHLEKDEEAEDAASETPDDVPF